MDLNYSALIHSEIADVEESRFASLDLHMQVQSQDNWCWAAVAVSVGLFFDPLGTWTQCELANALLEEADCCHNGDSDACDRYAYLEDSLSHVGKFRGKDDRALDFASVRSEIDRGRPICLRVEWFGDGAHYLAISGYSESSGSRIIMIEDSSHGQTAIPFESFPDDYRIGGTWTDTYWTSP